MCAHNNDTKPVGYINCLLKQKCSRCRLGDMFEVRNAYNLKSFMKMHGKCPVCGQVFEIEIGFYYGTSYVSYALTVAISIFTCIAWWVTIGFSLDDYRFFTWMGVNMGILILAQPFLMRLSRAIWLSFFVRYDRDWRTHTAEMPQRTGTLSDDPIADFHETA